MAPPDHPGRVCLVTGATSGIGQETARALAALGWTVGIVGRDPARTEATRQALVDATGNPHVHAHLADLTRLTDVRALAAEVLASYPQLHVLVNNAGAVYRKREVTAEGLEKTWAVNHVAPFLLTQLLLERLVASAPARVVNVSSQVHERGKLDFTDLQLTRGYSTFKAYGNAKLANVMFTYELARRLAGTGVTANVLHPGLVATEIGSKAFGWLAKLLHPFSLSVEEGARSSIKLASDPALEGVTGQYFVAGEPARSLPASYDEAAARRLWDATQTLLSAP